MIHFNNLTTVENYIDITNLGCGLSNVSLYLDCPVSYYNHTTMFFKVIPSNMTAKAFLTMSIPTQTTKYNCTYIISSNQLTDRKNITFWFNDLSCPIITGWENWTLFNNNGAIPGKSNNLDVNGLPNETTEEFNSFIMQNVLKSYFDEHIKLVGGRSRSYVNSSCFDCPVEGLIKGEVYADYNLSVEGYEVPFELSADVTWNDYRAENFGNGTLKCATHEMPISYDFVNPPLLKDYKNLITKENALEFVKNCSGNTSDYSVSLSGSGITFIAVGENKTAYLNLENGNITQCADNAIVQSAGGYSKTGGTQTGENTNNVTSENKVNWQNFVYVILIIIIAVIIVALMIIKRKPKEIITATSTVQH
jgi:hypothetical protein